MRTADPSRRRRVIEVLYVQDRPHYRATLALVDRVRVSWASTPLGLLSGQVQDPMGRLGEAAKHLAATGLGAFQLAAP
jgi:hypothetical protein